MADTYISGDTLKALQDVARRFMDGVCTIERRAANSGPYELVQEGVPCLITGLVRTGAGAGSANPYQQSYATQQTTQMRNGRIIELPIEYEDEEGATVHVDVRDGDRITRAGIKYKAVEAHTDETIPVSIVVEAERIDRETG